jgi:hypothetical protein
MKPAPTPAQRIAWTAVISGLLVSVLGAIVVNFVILPIRENSKARSAMAMAVHDLTLKVENMERWQAGMRRWKERMIAATGTVEIRRAVGTMPAPEPTDTTR